MINSHKDFKDIKLYYLKNTVTLIKQYFENLSQMNLQKKTVLVKQKPYCLFITGEKIELAKGLFFSIKFMIHRKETSKWTLN